MTPDQVNTLVADKFQELAHLLTGQPVRLTVITRQMLPHKQGELDVAFGICSTDLIEDVFEGLADILKAGIKTKDFKDHPYTLMELADIIEPDRKPMDS